MKSRLSFACIILINMVFFACYASGLENTPWLKVRSDPIVRVEINEVRIETQGPFSEKHFFITLHNPSSRQLEATLHLPLADNERLRGYALDVDGQLRNAVPVERVKARLAFEETVRRNVDPALMEKDLGNNYQLRVFPLPAMGQRKLRIDIAALAPRTVCGWLHQHKLGKSSGQSGFSLKLNSTVLPSQTDLNWVPSADGQTLLAQTQITQNQTQVSFCQPASAHPSIFTSQSNQQHALFVDLPVPPTGQQARPLPGKVEIVWDASASSKDRDIARELDLLRSYFKGRNAEVFLTILRNQVERSQYIQIQAGNIDPLIQALHSQVADGASLLATWQAHPEASEVLFFSDAIASWPGPSPAHPTKPVFVISAQANFDPAMAAYLARAGGDVITLSMLSNQEATAKLLLDNIRILPPIEPIARAWQMASSTPAGNALRACRLDKEARDASLTLANSEGQRVYPLPIQQAQAAPAAAFWCASWLAEALAIHPEQNQAALSRLGRDFGIATLETSLLVLERDEDYLRYGISPTDASPEQIDRVQLRLAQMAQDRERQANHQLNRLRQAWQARSDWWASPFPKGEKPQLVNAESDYGDYMPPPPPPLQINKRLKHRGSKANRRRFLAPPPPSFVPPPEVRISTPAPTQSAITATTSERPAVFMPATPAPSGRTPPTPANSQIFLQTIRPDEPYLPRLQASSNAAAVYNAYLDLRPDYSQSPAFYLDVAERLFELGDKNLALRVLSNIVELLPRQHAALRLVAYRLQQADMVELALPLLERVRNLAPDEPQTFRDLGLAYGKMGQCQAAIDSFSHVALTPWPERFVDIGVIALAELHQQANLCSADLSRLEPELRKPLPLGLRVVLSWDLNDTDIDLLVTDPNQDTVFYGHPLSHQGGRISRDFTAGYGPEEFILKNPKPGRYRVEINYFGSRLARLARGAVAQLRLQTGFGEPNFQEKIITLRLAEKQGKILVGHFQVLPNGKLQ